MSYAPYKANQNLFANGDLNLKGRGTSSVSLSNSRKWVFDRWFALDTNNTNNSTYQEISSTLDGISMKVARLSWGFGSGDIVFGQIIPSLNSTLLKNKTVTVSFLARLPALAYINPPFLSIKCPTVKDDWTVVQEINNVQFDNPISGSYWAKLSATIHITNNLINNGAEISIVFPSGQLNEVFITRLMMNEGSLAGDFSLAADQSAGETVLTGSTFDSEAGFKQTLFSSSDFLSIRASTEGLKFLNSNDVEFFKYQSSTNDFTFGRAIAGIYTFASKTAITLPTGTTGERTGSPVGGQLRYNSTTSRIETWTPSISGYDNIASERYATAEAIKYSIVFG
jgi:hypothetical protein